MKKLIMSLALLALPFAMQAQTKFHDVEANDAVGAVKKIESTVMGRQQVVTFTQEGKMQQEGMKDAKYDADGFVQSVKMEAGGMSMTITYKWENGKVKSQSMEMMGRPFTTTNKYDEAGVLVGQSMDMGEQTMEMNYTDIKLDGHGNWISRKTTMMGQEIEQTRTIEYYE